jgi:phosphoribosylformimino-5-aminoimidazole carboxamide ribotide isomerase
MHPIHRSLRIIPVLDLKAGQVVRARAGRRQDYLPISSRLTQSADPMAVAQAFRARFHLTELYLADLDAIAGAPPALPTYAALRSLGFRLWIDAGVREVTSSEPLAAAGIEQIVVGLETVAGPEELANICQRIGPDRAVFSLDLKDGLPLGNLSRWQTRDPWLIATQAIAMGVRRVILLDLARVGEHAGTGTEELCKRLASRHPEVEIVAGGGIRDRTDLQHLEACGVRAALVASALHDGELRPEELAGFTGRGSRAGATRPEDHP